MKKLLLILGICILPATMIWGDCVYTGDVRNGFGGCSPSIGVQVGQDPNLNVVDKGSDFRETLASIIRRAQIVTAVVAVAIIVWLGLAMVLPTSAEAKESTKSKLISVILGFLAMISATLIVEGLINLLYGIFK